MNKQKKLQMLILLVFFAVSTMMIAFFFSGMYLSLGLPAPEIDNQQNVTTRLPVFEIDSMQKSKFNFSVILLVLGGSGAVMILFQLRKTSFRDVKSVLKIFFSGICVLLFFLFLYLFMQRNPLQAPVMARIVQEETARAPEYIGIPSFLPIAVAVVCAAVFGVVLLRFLLAGRKKNPVLESLEDESRIAKEALDLGADLREVVIRYYKNLCMVLKSEQSIERESFLTVQEFERKLTLLGVPPDPVKNITDVFESSRYGEWAPDQKKTVSFIESIDQIMDYFRNNATGSNHG